MTWISMLDATLGVAVLIRMLCILDHMSSDTCHWVRVAGVMLAVAALAVTVRPWYLAGTPEWPTVLLHAAIAIWLWVDRRQPGGLAQWRATHGRPT
jgi:hypothetical protein